jgi:hypothetical protein
MLLEAMHATRPTSSIDLAITGRLALALLLPR